MPVILTAGGYTWKTQKEQQVPAYHTAVAVERLGGNIRLLAPLIDNIQSGIEQKEDRNSLQESWVKEDLYAFHFCPGKQQDLWETSVYRKAAAYAGEAGAMISFCPDWLWGKLEDSEPDVEGMDYFLKRSHMLVISQPGLEKLTKDSETREATARLLQDYSKLKLVFCTRGAKGVDAATGNHFMSIAAPEVISVDSTGAGEAFAGALLFWMMRHNISLEELDDFNETKLWESGAFANGFAAGSVRSHGGVASYPDLDDTGGFCCE